MTGALPMEEIIEALVGMALRGIFPHEIRNGERRHSGEFS